MRLGFSILSSFSDILSFAQIDVFGAKFKLPGADFVKELKNLGFAHIEIVMDLMFLTGKEGFVSKTKEIVDEARRLGMTVSFHLPIYSIEPASFNERIRKASVEALIDAINLAEEFKPEIYVLHPTGPLAAEFTHPGLLEKIRMFAARIFAGITKKSLAEILHETGINPRKLAVENDKFPFLILKDVVEELNLSVCLDTGHALAGISGNVTPEELLEAFKDRIAEIHLHDGIFKLIDGAVKIVYHLPLGTSGYDFGAFLKRLGDFKGPIVLEMSFEDAKKSLDILKGREWAQKQ